MFECSRSLYRLLTTPVCSMSVGRMVDASVVDVPSYLDLQVGQWYAVSDVSAAGPLLRSPTTLEIHDVGESGTAGSALHADC